MRATEADPHTDWAATGTRDARVRLARAEVVDVSGQPPDRGRFGTTVVLEDLDSGDELTYRIVGEDEADPEHELVSWLSPLARALLGARVGDTVVWRRPAGDLEIEIVAIEPPAPEPGAD